MVHLQSHIDHHLDDLTPAMVSDDERNLAIIAHLGTFLGYLLPLSNIWIPLLIWGWRHNDSEFVVFHAKESLNFQLTLMPVWMAGLIFLLTSFELGVGTLLMAAVYGFVCTLSAIFVAGRGHVFHYPFTLQLISH